MARSWSNLVNNLSEIIRTIKCKYRHSNKKWETCGIKYVLRLFSWTDKFWRWFNANKCLHCNKNHQQKFDEKLKERFLNTC